jgi:hypothetical protein
VAGAILSRHGFPIHWALRSSSAARSSSGIGHTWWDGGNVFAKSVSVPIGLGDHGLNHLDGFPRANLRLLNTTKVTPLAG